ncbi:MAG: hypothetical protein VXZ27_11965, partial [SAR324 cluster bacterium]|nr:hypothetical protein [SAR324 cluster bacterium]
MIRQWGIIDVEDAVAGAEYLVRQQKADPQRSRAEQQAARQPTSFRLAFTHPLLDTAHAARPGRACSSRSA